MPKILIVEDDKNIVTFLSTILLGVGYTCLSAGTADTARALLESEPDISLVLLDQNLGEDSENGLGLLTALRQDSKFQGIPVIVCTGDSRTAVVSGFLGQRIAGFIKKPFKAERLVADVQRVFGQIGNSTPPIPPARRVASPPH